MKVCRYGMSASHPGCTTRRDINERVVQLANVQVRWTPAELSIAVQKSLISSFVRYGRSAAVCHVHHGVAFEVAPRNPAMVS